MLSFILQHKSMKLKPERLFEELKALAEQIGIEVIVDKGSFRGGYCTVHDAKKIVLNKHLPPEGKAAKLAESIKSVRTFPLEGMYLKPALREYLEMPSCAQHTTTIAEVPPGNTEEPRVPTTSNFTTN